MAAAFGAGPLLTLSDFWANSRRVIVAFSGGCDSSALLQLLYECRQQATLDRPLSAIHIHHGLSPRADQWQRHCEDFCAARDIPLSVYRASVTRRGASLEDRARTERYRIFEQHLTAGDLLALAHHADDQAETVLMRLLRGAGPRGAAGIPAARRLGAGRLVRPLLDVPRRNLEDYARSRALRWVNDHSNADVQHDRNFIRHRVMPLLRQRWPNAEASLLRSAAIAAQTQEMSDLLADQYLQQACDHRGIPRVSELLRLSPAQRRLLIRRWCDNCEVTPPPASRLSQLMNVLTAAADRAPQLCWRQHGGGEVMIRRYRDGLYLLRPLPAPAQTVLWQPLEQPMLDLRHGLLGAERGPGGIDLSQASRLEVRFRSGGEVCRPAGRTGSRALSKYLQEKGVPPWEREGLPLLYSDNRLAAVGNLAVCEGFVAPPGTEGLKVTWQSRAALSSAPAL